MSDTKNTGEKTLSVSSKKTLTLKRTVEQGTVRQSFSHGRSKAVVVEKRKRRIVTPDAETKAETVQDIQETVPTEQVKPVDVTKQEKAVEKTSTGQGLTNEERDARAIALKEAQVREAKEKIEAEKAAEERAEVEKQKVAEEAQRRAEEEVREKQKEEHTRHENIDKGPLENIPAELEPKPIVKAIDDAPAVTHPSLKTEMSSVKRAKDSRVEEDEGGQKSSIKAVRRPKTVENKVARTPRSDNRRRGKLTVTAALNEDEERGKSLAALKRRREKEKRKAQASPREKIIREVTIPETITVQDLANRMAERAVDVIRLMMKQDQMLKINDIIDADMAQLIVEEMGHTVKRVSEADVEEGLFTTDTTDNDNLHSRPPVVTIMGHVDHGKTSLLDAVRKTNVVGGEAGGITQHIGAYQIDHNGAKITFIDTPGHEAFTAMRARGAKATDIVILVVAADDGVMPTTIEAISHTREANVPIIVAINKIDKEGVDPSRVRNELLQHGIFVESLGGDILEVEVSALKGINLDKLLDAITLQAEIMELKANADRNAEGTVIEAKLDRGRGSVSTVLVQRGTLHQSDILVAGSEWARVRALIDDHGNTIKSASPSMPVEILGFQGTPEAGDRFAVVESEARAREITEYRQRLKREKISHARLAPRGSLEQMMNQLQQTSRSELIILVKADVQGSAEAINGALEKLGTDEVAARIIHSGVGGITESDVTLAMASEAPIIGFNVRANKQAQEAAERSGIEIRYYNIIYDLVNDIKAAMSGMLSPERRETFLGNAEIREVFNISKIGKIAGCLITEGVVERGAGVRLIRDNVVIHEGSLSTLKRFKDEVKQVASGQECGMGFENYQDIKAGDVIECYRVEEVARSL